MPGRPSQKIKNPQVLTIYLHILNLSTFSSFLQLSYCQLQAAASEVVPDFDKPYPRVSICFITETHVKELLAICLLVICFFFCQIFRPTNNFKINRKKKTVLLPLYLRECPCHYWVSGPYN